MNTRHYLFFFVFFFLFIHIASFFALRLLFLRFVFPLPVLIYNDVGRAFALEQHRYSLHFLLGALEVCTSLDMRFQRDNEDAINVMLVLLDEMLVIVDRDIQILHLLILFLSGF